MWPHPLVIPATVITPFRAHWTLQSFCPVIPHLSPASVDSQHMVSFPIPVTPHTFRHSFAMHLLMSGVPEKVLQSLLGHRYARSTETYTRVFALDVLTTHSLTFTIDSDVARKLLDGK